VTGRLTEIERKIVLFVAAHQPCRYEDVRLHMGYRSKGTAFEHMRRLRRLKIVDAPRNADGHTKSRTLQLGPDICVSDKGGIGWIVWMNGYREVQSDPSVQPT